MIALLFSLALLNGNAPASADADPAAPPSLPEPPAGHVLDRMEWLHRDRVATLESELARVREEHGIDIFVVVWDRRLRDGQSPRSFATHVGESWHRGPVWGTVLLTPGSIGNPVAVAGGTSLTKNAREHLGRAAAFSTEFGMRDWSDQDLLQQTALVLAEELVFASHAFAPPATAAAGSPLPQSASGSTPSLLSRPILIATGSLALVGILLVCFILRGRARIPASAEADAEPPLATDPEPGPRSFPAPDSKPGLGAPWSQGASLIVVLPDQPTGTP